MQSDQEFTTQLEAYQEWLDTFPTMADQLTKYQQIINQIRGEEVALVN
jgi:hypothetical protein